MECRIGDVDIEIDAASRFLLVLPDSPDFRKADLRGREQGETEKVEK